MAIRVLLADDQFAVRAAFRLIIDAQPDMTVVGEAPDGAAALELARHLRPDVVLADVRMPHLNGIELTRALAGPDVDRPIRVVVITTFDLDDYVHAALRHGASGFLLKRSGPTLMVEAIRAAVAGDTLISPQVTARLLAHLTSPGKGPGRPPRAPLTGREIDVVRLVASGHSNAEIADDLRLSVGTVKGHVANIHRKLGVRNRVEIAIWAYEAGHVSR
ncbi:response regulator transcription factor [Cryptosporangium minutisporangium]|uniref:Response regulator transcription factor n=1 Tax=Cryptosporangium minutisporangium TaxID=113569 RepID=A0ABP6SRQ9_9ACTN